jgi:hypothetical protein
VTFKLKVKRTSGDLFTINRGGSERSVVEPQPEIRRRRSTCVDASTRVDLELKKITVLRLKKAYIDACSHMSTNFILFHFIEYNNITTAIDVNRLGSIPINVHLHRKTYSKPERQTLI